MNRRTSRTQHRDSGAALLLAIGSVFMISAISAGLAAAATSSLNNRTALQLVRDREYAADGAIEEAISWVRLQDGPDPVNCSAVGSRPAVTLNGVVIRVDWKNTCPAVSPTLDAPAPPGTPVAQRNVIFSAFCANPVDAKCNFADVIIRAQVNLAPASGPVTKTYVQSWSVTR